MTFRVLAFALVVFSLDVSFITAQDNMTTECLKQWQTWNEEEKMWVIEADGAAKKKISENAEEYKKWLECFPEEPNPKENNPAQLTTRAIARAMGKMKDKNSDTPGDFIPNLIQPEGTNETYMSCHRGYAHDCHVEEAQNQRLHCYRSKFKNEKTGDETIISTCQCDHWFGFTNEIDLQKGDKFCFEARCVYGKHACNARNGRSTYFIVMTSIMATLAVITFFRAFHVAWLMKKANKWKNNATSTALVFNMIASLFWFPLVIGYDLAISEGDWGISDTLASIGIPFIFASLCVAYLNISLVWVQVAATSTSLKKVGKNMQRKTWIIVLSFSTFVMVAQLGLCAVQQFGYALIFGIVVIIILCVVFTYGWVKFKGVMATMGKGSAMQQRLRDLNQLMIRFVIFQVIVLSFIITYIILTREFVRTYYTADALISTLVFIMFPGMGVTDSLTRYIKHAVLRKKERGAAKSTVKSTRRGTNATGGSNATGATTTTTTTTRKGSVVPVGGPEDEGKTTVANTTTAGEDEGTVTVVAAATATADEIDEGVTVVAAD